MEWLIGVIEAAFLEWAYTKGSAWVMVWIAKIKLYYDQKNEQESDANQVKLVEQLAEQVKAFIKAKQPVPPELEKRLREESRKLNFGGSQS